jgi:hypothetical protein
MYFYYSLFELDLKFLFQYPDVKVRICLEKN